MTPPLSASIMGSDASIPIPLNGSTDYSAPAPAYPWPSLPYNIPTVSSTMLYNDSEAACYNSVYSGNVSAALDYGVYGNAFPTSTMGFNTTSSGHLDNPMMHITTTSRTVNDTENNNGKHFPKNNFREIWVNTAVVVKFVLNLKYLGKFLF